MKILEDVLFQSLQKKLVFPTQPPQPYRKMLQTDGWILIIWARYMSTKCTGLFMAVKPYRYGTRGMVGFIWPASWDARLS